MKRAGNLYQKIMELKNLELAFWKAQKGKSGKKDVQVFRADLQNNLQMLQSDLQNGPSLGNYHYFTIYDPKERVICAANFRERVLHHAIINVCEPYFEKFQIYDSYACRKGKGMDPCLTRAQQYCRKFNWYLKLDIHKFFDTIPHDRLLQLLERRFKDPHLLNLFSSLVESYEVQQNCGIPIGNLTSQFFANFYLAHLDHELKNVCRVPGYIRYMDDFLLFSDDKKELQNLQKYVESFLKHSLKLELNPAILNRTCCGISFLSYRIYPHELRLSVKAKKRFVRKIAVANALESADHALPLLAFLNRANSYGFRKSILYGKRTNGSNRVIRGGSWNNNANNCQVANRNNNNPDNRNNNNGFRLALVPAQRL